MVSKLIYGHMIHYGFYRNPGIETGDSWRLRRENALISGVILSIFSVAGLHVDTIGDFSSEQLLHDRFSSLFATEDVSRGITSAQSVSSGEAGREGCFRRLGYGP